MEKRIRGRCGTPLEKNRKIRKNGTKKMCVVSACGISEKSIKCGSIILPEGVETCCGILSHIFQFLNLSSLLNVIKSSMIKQLCVTLNSNDIVRVREEALAVHYDAKDQSIYEMVHNQKQLYLLYKRYMKEFPYSEELGTVPSLLICACNEGRIFDIKQFITLHRFHKYIDLDVPEADMDLKSMLNHLGYDSDGWYMTAIMGAVWNQHTDVVKYLLNFELDLSLNGTSGYNVLQCVAFSNKRDTDITKLLLNKMSLNDINHVDTEGCTAVDICHRFNKSRIKDEIITLIRNYGGKSNWFNEDGKYIGRRRSFRNEKEEN
eukprot:g1367.t1